MKQLHPEASLVIQSLGWALLHSLWQGALVALCLWLTLTILRNAGARWKYHLYLSSLFALCAWFLTTWIQQWQQLAATNVHVTATTRNTAVTYAYSVHPLAPAGKTASMLLHLLPGVERVFPIVVLLYVVGIGLMLLRFGIGISRLLPLRFKGIVPAEPYWEAYFTQLKERLMMTQKVRLSYSTRIDMPVMLGYFKPIILLPVAMVSQLTTEQVAAILLHELSHIKRHDYLVNILQIAVETVLFFNPFMWWISAGIRREREHCCDDLVLAQTEQPLPYVTALVALEHYRNLAKPLTLAAGGQHHHLLNRIKRITNMKKSSLNYGRLAAAIIIMSALGFSICWFSPASAQQQKVKKAITSVTSQKIILIDDQGNRKEYDRVEDLPQEEQEKLAQKLRNSGINGSGASYFNFDREEMTKKEFEDLKGDLNEMMSGFPMPAMPDAPAHWPFTSPNDQNPLTDDFDLLIATTPIPSKAMDQLKRKSLEAASKTLDAIDWSTIDRSAQEAIKQADKALLQTNSALQHVDWTAIDRQIDDAIKQVDATDWDAIVTVNGTRKNNRAYSRQLKKELAGARRAAVLAANRNRQAAGYSRTFAADRRERVEDRKRTLEERRSIVASRGAGNNAYQGIINKMEEDGLLDQARSFTIVKKGDQITINGKTQPSSVSEKYRSYFPDRDVTIAGSANRLTILEADEIETR